MIAWLRRRWRRPSVPTGDEGRGDMQVEPARDEQIDLLRHKLRTAQARLTLVQAEVKAMQVDAGVIQRDYEPPRRRPRPDEGHQPA